MATVLNYGGSDAKKDADITTTVSEDTKSDIKDTGAPPLGAPIDKSGGIWRRGKPRLDLDSVATQLSVFDDPAGLEAYRPPPQYENAHRFDPDARWTWREEQVSMSLDSLALTAD